MLVLRSTPLVPGHAVSVLRHAQPVLGHVHALKRFLKEARDLETAGPGSDEEGGRACDQQHEPCENPLAHRCNFENAP